MALRDHPRISTKRREQIQSLAVEMGYAPNLLSKALREGKTKTIGILLPSLTAHVAIMRTHVMEAAARKAGYCSLISCLDNDDDTAIYRAVAGLLGRQVDGLVLAMSPTRAFPQRVMDLIRQCPRPTVFLGWAPPHCRARVTLNSEAALDALAQHLADLGHQNIVMVESQWMRKYPDHRRTLLASALQRRALTLDNSDDWILDADVTRSTEERAYELIRRNLERGLKPDAILGNDHSAAAAIAAATDLGLRIPQDMSVAGFDNLPIASIVRPALTTIRFHNQRAADHAMCMLFELINAPDTNVQPVAVEAELIVRQSTGFVPEVSHRKDRTT